MPALRVDAKMLPVPDPSVICQKVDEGAVLFSAATELYFGLNESGAAVWELLASAGGSEEALCAALAHRYPDAEPEAIRADVEELLARLLAEGLVLMPGAGPPDAGAAP